MDTITWDIKERCPRCGGQLRTDPKDCGALSRADNKTFVCTPCCREEALITLYVNELAHRAVLTIDVDREEEGPMSTSMEDSGQLVSPHRSDGVSLEPICRLQGLVSAVEELRALTAEALTELAR